MNAAIGKRIEQSLFPEAATDLHQGNRLFKPNAIGLDAHKTNAQRVIIGIDDERLGGQRGVRPMQRHDAFGPVVIFGMSDQRSRAIGSQSESGHHRASEHETSTCSNSRELGHLAQVQIRRNAEVDLVLVANDRPEPIKCKAQRSPGIK